MRSRGSALVVLTVTLGCATGDTALELGEPCKGPSDCASGICIDIDGDEHMCSEECEDECSKPGFKCTRGDDGASYCVIDPNAVIADGGTGGTGGGGICQPGASQACVCAGGLSGLQACTFDGLGYGPCVCSESDGGTGDDGFRPPPPPPPGRDASPPPPPNDAAVDPPALPPQGNLTCSDVLGCQGGCQQGGDSGCYQACFERGTFTGQATFYAFARCVNRVGCGTLEECQGRCPGEYQRCVADAIAAPMGCGAVFFCIQMCYRAEQGFFCQEGCVDASSPAAAQRYAALEQCMRQSACPTFDACEQACPAQVNVCFSDP